MLRKLALRAQDLVRRAMMGAFSVLPMREVAVFASFSGKAYSDSPKAISEALHARMPGLRIVWLFRDPAGKAATAPYYVRRVRIHSPLALLLMATARIWVDNMPKPDYTRKRRGILYIQTWHGDRGFKKMLYDAPDHPAGRVLYESDICDIMTSGSTFCEGTYRTGFGYQGEILRCGSPRNDALLSPDPGRIAATKRAIGVPSECKILLYAPTMRNASRRAGIVQPIQPIDIPRTLDLLGPEWVCVVRAHSTQIGLGGLPDDRRIADASGYEDMADLLAASDMLITDYSSCAGDFALTGRPIVLFQEDREGFAREERTFYFDIDSTPYVVVHNQKELEIHLREQTPEAATANCEAVLRFYGAYETGRAAELTAEWIQQHMC